MKHAVSQYGDKPAVRHRDAPCQPQSSDYVDREVALRTSFYGEASVHKIDDTDQ